MALDPHLANVSLLLHCDGADGSSDFIDSSPTPKNIAVVQGAGSARISTEQSKFGGSCIRFSSGAITVPADESTAFGPGDFTIEFWVHATSGGNKVLFDQQINEYGADAWRIYLNEGVPRWVDPNYGELFGSASVADGQWHHVAFVRAGGMLRLFVDGVFDAELLVASSYSEASAIGIGAPISYDYGPDYFAGYLDEIRITKGVARYTADFAPPAEPFPPGVALLALEAYATAPALFGAAQSLALSVTGAWVAAPSPLVVVRAESGADVVVAPKSLATARFGTPMALVGLQPSDAAFPARSLTAGRFGVASFASTLQVGPVQGLQSVWFGPLGAHVALPASGLSPAQFGAPSVVANASANSLRPVRFGAVHAAHHLAAASLDGTRFGAPALRLVGMTAAASSLRPALFGVPSLGVVAMRARTMYPVRFGQPALDRGVSC